MLAIHSLIHGTMSFLWGSHALSFLQVPVHPFLLLVCFNIFSSSPNPWLIFAAEWWGTLLTLSGPLFIAMEGLSSLLVVQKLGQEGKRLVGKGEAYQFGLLIATSIAYVASAWWIVDVSLVPFKLSATSYLSTKLPVISNRCIIAPFIHFARSRYHSVSFPHNHRLCSSQDQYYRILGACCFHRL